MVKRALTLLTSILFALPLLMPFNIFGATWGDAPIVGLNITMINIDNERAPLSYTVNLDTDQTRWRCVSSSSTMGCQTWVSQNTSDTVTSALDGNISVTNQNFNSLLYEYEFVFDKSYVGWIQTDFSSTTTGYTPKVIYVNGKTAKFTSNTVYTSFSVTNYSLTYAPEEFLNITRQYNFPLESYTFVNQFYKNNYEIVDQFDHGYYDYPLFSVPSGSRINSLWSNGSDGFNQILIIGIARNVLDTNSFLTYFNINNISIKSFDTVYRKDQPNGEYNQFSIIRVEYNIENTSNGNFGYFSLKNNEYIIPIFCDYYSDRYKKYFSTDFALHYGLRNELLDNLNIIANGTAQSSSAAQSSDSANSQLQTDSNTLFQQENGFKSDMQNAMQNVNNTFRLQDMGTKFVSSAQWVRTQYEQLTNNTPFASLITFSLITGLALILLGKVYK